MDVQLFYWILGISGALILILLSIIGYFLQQNFQTNKEVSNTTNKLNVTIRVLIQKMKNYDEKHDVTTDRLNKHAKRLDQHEVDIATLKQIIE